VVAHLARCSAQSRAPALTRRDRPPSAPLATGSPSSTPNTTFSSGRPAIARMSPPWRSRARSRRVRPHVRLRRLPIQRWTARARVRDYRVSPRADRAKYLHEPLDTAERFAALRDQRHRRSDSRHHHAQDTDRRREKRSTSQRARRHRRPRLGARSRAASTVQATTSRCISKARNSALLAAATDLATRMHQQGELTIPAVRESRMQPSGLLIRCGGGSRSKGSQATSSQSLTCVKAAKSAANRRTERSDQSTGLREKERSAEREPGVRASPLTRRMPAPAA
jgi:hypothetical protein